MTAAEQLVALLAAREETVATAESLTGGLLVATIVEVPGASDVVAGGVVAYTPQAKAEVLGVDAELLADCGTVDPDVAVQMAERARALFGSDWALSATGVAGPGPHEGHPAGTVHVGVAGAARAWSFPLALDGDRAAVRQGSVEAAISTLTEVISA